MTPAPPGGGLPDLGRGKPAERPQGLVQAAATAMPTAAPIAAAEPDFAAPAEDDRGAGAGSARHLSLAEQGLISGSNFLVLIAAARILPKEALGAFSFALATLLLFQGLIQRAFVLLPMSTTGKSRDESVHNLAFWRWVQAGTMAAILALMGAFYLVARGFLDAWIADSVLVALIVVVPSFYMEFLRRVVLLTSTMPRLLLMGCAYAGTIAIFAAVALLSDHTPGLFAFALCLCAAGLASCLVSGARPLPRGGFQHPVGWTLPSYWRFARWSVGASLGSAGYSFGIQSILAAMAGPVALAGYAAARNLVQPVSTLMQAMDNVDKARAGRAFAQTGMAGLWGVVRHSWTWLFMLAIPYFVFVAALSDWILPLLYGSKYGDITDQVRLWCLVMAAMIVVQPLETALYAVRRPDLLFYGRLPSACLAMLLAPALILQSNEKGALVAVVLGWCLAGLTAAWQLRRLSAAERAG